MSLAPGTKLGPYEVVAAIGAGGMGQVHRARDARLGRDVALKVLPQAFANDADRLARFEREARALASLNHPNIAQIYGVEAMTAGGRETSAIVMEFVAGRTLDSLIRHAFERRTSTFELSDVVPIARQIALALEAAHDAGVVHRDLKPANIIVRDDGVVKVLDFGLARIASDTEGAEGTEVTETSPAMTQAGVILGTAAYMSPEQAKGRVADRRADIWAFGAVLFEMLTGERLFAGATVTEVLAAVLKDPIRLDRLPPRTPAALRQLIGRCLERDPRMRLRDIGEARIALTGMQTGDDSAPASVEANRVASGTESHRGLRMSLGVAGALALAALTAYAAWQLKPAAASIAVRRFALPAEMASATHFAISPDGSRIAYFRQGHLFVHALATAVTADLGIVPANADGPLWSPDGRRLAYVGESELRIIPAEGGSPFTVCGVPGSGEMTKGWWHDDGTIYFAVWREHLYRVAASGGTPVQVTAVAPEKEIDFHSVAVLPDGRQIVTTHLRGEDLQRLELVDGGVRTPLAEDLDIDIVALGAPNALVFVRLRTNPGVWTVPFDGGRVDLTRATLLEAGARDFSLSSEGTLVSTVLAHERRELVWVSHGSTSTGPGQTSSTRSVATMSGEPFDVGLGGLALSHDGRRAVFAIRGANGREEYVVRDLATGRDTRVPAPKAATGVSTGGTIAWSPAGRLLYPAGGVEALQIYDWPADGSANGRPLVSGMTAQMTPDGRNILFTRDERSHMRLYRAPIRPDGTAGDAEPVFPKADDPNVRNFNLSPDGTLLAFTDVDAADRRNNLFITTWPDLRERHQVTTDGASRPRFSTDSRRLFYRGGNPVMRTGNSRAGLRVVTITRSPWSVGTPRLLMVEGEPGTPTAAMFAVGADDRLLMTRPVPQSLGDAARMVLLQNWRAAAGRQ